ncbi:MAG: diguanylate cyclase [Eubacterium sp.]|nr:diguanylate cyclase [Eubacterium sp.]
MNVRMSLTMRMLVLVVFTLVVLNGATGYILIYYSQDAIKTQIKNRMLDLSNTAAASIDGDIYEKIEADDKGTPEYEALLDKLRLYQDNIELEYIYGIRDNGDKNFTFTIDPAVDDPGEFGEPIEYTDALYKASLGVPAVDEIAYEDKWGKFYSSYSPIRNSKGEVVGILAVDFDATWYEKNVTRNMRIIISSCIVSILIGILLALIATSRLRYRFRTMDQEMYEIETDLDKFVEENSVDGDEEKTKKDTRYPRGIISYSKDEIDILGEHIQAIVVKVRDYANDLNAHSFIDDLTGVENRKAYSFKIAELDKKIELVNSKESDKTESNKTGSKDDEDGETGDVEFALAVFDVKGMKKINEEFGYHVGDMAIKCAANAINNTYVGENEYVYHLSGDEFVVIIEGKAENDIEGTFILLDEHLNSFNKKNEEVKNEAGKCLKVSVSRGYSIYDKTRDKNYESVFRRAESVMWNNKTTDVKP